MRRFELGMSLDYVSNWSIVDAIREIFQNALDEEIENPDNKWYFNYDKDNEVLRIGNKLSRLDTKSLLLGCSTKRDDNRTIGQHGEGYKVATIVLLRNGCNIKVYNYNEREIWTAKVVKSRRYNTEIGVYDVENMGVFKSVPENSLIFEISNISSEIYDDIKSKNLWLQDDVGRTLDTEYGRVLLNKSFKGKVFVKGLYVCDKEQLNYGYDLSPTLINLDRDRGLVDSFNLQFQLGKLLVHVDDIDFINDTKNLWDGYYIKSFLYYEDKKSNYICDFEYDKFIEKYGKDAIPCNDNNDYNRLRRKGLNVAFVNDNEYYYITRSKKFSPKEDIDDISLSADLENWVGRTKEYLPDELYNEGLQLVEDILKIL